MLATLVFSLGSLQVPVTAEEQGLTLHESKSGATVTLPEDWVLAKGEGGLMAHSEDDKGFVALIDAKKDFEAVRQDVRALVLSRLDDVTVEGVEAEGVDERGALGQLVAARGTGTSKLDGAEVDFAGLLVGAERGTALVLGAWKDDANRATVERILGSLRVQESAGKGGLVFHDAATGASVTIPEGWAVLRNRKGLIAAAPDRKALAVLMNWQGDFEAAVQKMRATLLKKVFDDVEIGEFAVVEASYHKSLGRVIAAEGSAVDRVDDLPVEFTALRIQSVDENRGAAFFGAWKDEEHAEQIAELVKSIKIEKRRE